MWKASWNEQEPMICTAIVTDLHPLWQDHCNMNATSVQDLVRGVQTSEVCRDLCILHWQLLTRWHSSFEAGDSVISNPALR